MTNVLRGDSCAGTPELRQRDFWANLIEDDLHRHALRDFIRGTIHEPRDHAYPFLQLDDNRRVWRLFGERRMHRPTHNGPGENLAASARPRPLPVPRAARGAHRSWYVAPLAALLATLEAQLTLLAPFVKPLRQPIQSRQRFAVFRLSHFFTPELPNPSTPEPVNPISSGRRYSHRRSHRSR